MNGILLTQNSTAIFKYIVFVLGKIMEGIFNLLDAVGIANVGLSIIIFTIIVNVAMIPLTYKQQKFSKLSQKMNPEIKAIQKKYEGKKDQNSNIAQNNEIQAVYAKYGVSPTGSCLYLLIQMPILFALYRVIYAMPAYVGKIKEAFFPLVTNLISTSGATELVQGFTNSMMFSKQFGNAEYDLSNTIIDCLNRASTADFQSIADKFPNLSADVANTVSKLNVYNNFLGLNIGNTPWFTIKESFASGRFLLVIGALMIPVLAGFTQWITVKLSPQQSDMNNGNSGNAQADSMAQSMKTMNTMMPLMSVWFCFTMPAGMGLYWVAGAVVRGVIMVIMNKKIDKIDFDQLISQNSVKNEKKLAKMKEQQERLNAYANMNTRNIQGAPRKSISERSNSVTTSGNYAGDDTNVSTNKNYSSGSMFAKANMVSEFNNKNTK